MKKLFLYCILIILHTPNLISQITYLAKNYEGEGGIDGISYPLSMFTDSSEQDFYIVTERCITQLRKVDYYNFNSINIYLNNRRIHEVKPCLKGKFYYATAENQIYTLLRNPSNGALEIIDSIKNKEGLIIGSAGSTHIAISPDNNNLYLGTTYNFKKALHIFKINPSSGFLIYKYSIVDTGNLYKSIICSPNSKFIYTVSGLNDDTQMCTYRKLDENDSLELIQTFTRDDSITAPACLSISNDGKHLYCYDSWYLKLFEVDSITGKLLYIDKLLTSSYYNEYIPHDIDFSSDGRFLYMAHDNGIAIFERRFSDGRLTFVQYKLEFAEGQSNFNSIHFTNHDSILYALNNYNHSIFIYNRNSTSGRIDLIKKIGEHDGMTFGLWDASDMLVTHDNKTVLTLSSVSNQSIAIFDRLNEGILKFQRNILRSELGPEISMPLFFKITSDDKYLYITAKDMYGIRLILRDPDSKELAFSKYYDEKEIGFDPGQIFDLAITPDDNFIYAATYNHIIVYSIDKENGELAFQSCYSIPENSTAGLRGISSIAVSANGKYIYTGSISSFYPVGISVYLRDSIDGSISWFQTIKDVWVNKILVSRDNKFLYALGTHINHFSINSLTEHLIFKSKTTIDNLNSFNDGIITNDDKAIIAVSKVSKAVVSFYRDTETGNVLLKENKKYSSREDYSYSHPTIKMSVDSKNVYVVEPYERTLLVYKTHVPLGLKSITEACEGESALLHLDEGYEYEWSNGDTTNELNVTIAGNYSVYVKDTLGREGWDHTSVIVNPKPDFTFVIVGEIYNEDTTYYLRIQLLEGELPIAYFWEDGAHAPSRLLSENDFTQNKKFTLQIIDNNFCKSSTKTAEVGARIVGMNDLSEQSKLFVFPNPVDNYITICFPAQPLNSYLEIYNSSGIMVYHSVLEGNIPEHQLDFRSFDSGAYIIKLILKNKIYTRKFVKR